MPTRPPTPKDCRCLCGGLLARLVSEGVELKCRRCKRTLVIPWADPSAWQRPTTQMYEVIKKEEVG